MFITALDVRYPAGKSRERTLLNPLVYFGNKDSFVVPAGFKTDFASIPRFLWGILPPDGEYIRAAVVHDYLYRCKPMVRDEDGFEIQISRADADGIFKRIMAEEGVARWKQYIMWIGVVQFGRKAWNE